MKTKPLVVCACMFLLSGCPKAKAPATDTKTGKSPRPETQTADAGKTGASLTKWAQEQWAQANAKPKAKAGVKGERPAPSAKARPGASKVLDLLRVIAKGDPSKSLRARMTIGMGGEPMTPGLVAALADSNKKVREAAVDQLVSSGDKAVPALLAGLESHAASVEARKLVLMILGAVGANDARVVPALVKALDDPSPELRVTAAIGVKSVVQRLRSSEKTHEDTKAMLGGVGFGQDGLEDEKVRRAGRRIRQQLEAAAPALSRLILSSTDKDLRTFAALAIAEMGALGRSATPDMLKGIVSDRTHTRLASAHVLGKVGVGDEVVAALCKATSDKETAVRTEAIQSLRAIGTGAEQAVPALLAALALPSPTRDTAAYALGAFGAKAASAAPRLIDLLTTGAVGVRHSAVDALGKIGAVKGVVPALTKALSDKEEKVRAGAALALGAIGPQAAPAVPRLREHLRGQAILTRLTAARALGQIGDPARASTPELLRALTDSGAELREEAAQALGRMKATSAIPQLIRALDDKNDEVRGKAVAALATIGAAASKPLMTVCTSRKSDKVRFLAASILTQIDLKRALPILIGWLSGRSKTLSVSSATLLGVLGPKGKPAVPALVKSLPRLGLVSGGALGLIGPSAAPAVVQALKSADRLSLGPLLHAVSKLGPAAGGSLPILVELLKDDRGSREMLLIPAIASLGVGAVPSLKTLLRDPDFKVRRRALMALGWMGPEAGSALGVIMAGLDDTKNASIAAESLGKLGIKASPAIDRLIAALDGANGYMRETTVNSLGRIDPSDPRVRAALKRALSDENAKVRSAARSALDR